MDYQFLKKSTASTTQSIQQKNSKNPVQAPMQRLASHSGAFSAANIVQLQSIIGNRAVGRLLSSTGLGMTQAPVIQKMKGYDKKTPNEWKAFFNEQKNVIEINFTPRVKEMLKTQITEYNDHLQFMDESWGTFLDETIREGVVEEAYNLYQKIKDFIPRVKDTMGLDKSLPGKKGKADTKIENITVLINKTKLNPMQISFATKLQIDTMNNSKVELEGIRNEHSTKLEPLSEALTTFSSLTELPTNEQIITAKSAITTYDEAPKSKSTDALVVDIDKVNNELNEVNIKIEIKKIVQEAVDNQAKQLDLNDAKVTKLVNKLYLQNSTKTEITNIINNMVHDQHNPGKETWLNAIGLYKTNNLWIKNGVGTIDGIDAHSSLYTDNIPDNPSVNTALPQLQDDILGNGVTGFHVTLEKFGPYGTDLLKNPHSYRGGPTIKNNFPDAELGMQTWLQVRPQLDLLKDVQVTQAENDISDFKQNLGKR